MNRVALLDDYRRATVIRVNGLKRVLAAALLLLSSSLLFANDDAVFSEIVVFGDSYSDTGNVYLATGFAIPESPPYFAGRFSNGPLWHEVVADRLGLAPAQPDLIGGTNYAWGGAQTGEGIAILGTPNLGLQIDTFLARAVPRSDQLFVVAGGGNDLIQPVPPTAPEVIVDNIAAHVTELAESGARYFAVPNLPTISELPYAALLGDETANELKRLTSKTNRMLRPRLRRLENELKHAGMDVEIAHVNWNRSFRILLRFPALIGVDDIDGTGLGSPDPNRFFWFDSLHPTAPVHDGVGRFAVLDIRRQLLDDDDDEDDKD